MFDIDHFKSINDTYGDPVGDQVIKAVGDYCKTMSRSNDLWVRYGGEEFLGILPEADLIATVTYAERLRSDLEKFPIETTKGVISITVSGGYASFTPAERQFRAEEMIDMVARALYQAKESGRNRMVQGLSNG